MSPMNIITCTLFSIICIGISNSLLISDNQISTNETILENQNIIRKKSNRR